MLQIQDEKTSILSKKTSTYSQKQEAEVDKFQSLAEEYVSKLLEIEDTEKMPHFKTPKKIVAFASLAAEDTGQSIERLNLARSKSVSFAPQEPLKEGKHDTFLQ